MTEAGAALDARAAAEAVARASYGKLVALLAARTRDVAVAEDALAEAFTAALVQWPTSGVPAKPVAWLLSVARRRGIDAMRRRRTATDSRQHLELLAEEAESRMDDDIPDERLRLIFACAHPAIDRGVRAALILQTVLGVDAATIASAFLVSPSTMAQRLVRAKARIREAGIPFRVPERAELGERLSAVLEAIYAAYSEGWGDPSGLDSRRTNLAGEAIWLGRLVSALMPDEAEAQSLVALMLFAEARRGARRDPDGNYVPLGDQDTSLWDNRMIDEAEARLMTASGLSGDEGIGRYQLEAAIQAVHAARRVIGRTDWPALATLYHALALVSASPAVAVSRAVALAAIEGPRAALGELDRIAPDRRLADYQPYWATRARLLADLGESDAARAAYDRAIGLERDPAVRRFLTGQRGAA
ncbi:MAG: RNA polymerase subunit sigma-70 [Hyphomicrobiales bacterium]|nr:RNA polymerase subunit sigma-70 [Hyphomicrobiales bacterium]